MIKKVSVIIPVYNGEKTIGKCLESVMNQTYKDYEVLVVDNNSTDKTKEIIEKNIKRDKRIVYIFENKRNRSIARNAGIKNASGDIIAMTDADCIVPVDWIEKLTKPIREGNEKAVMGNEEDLIKNYWTKNMQNQDIESYGRSLKEDYIYTLDTKNFAIKASIAKKIKFDSRLNAAEDIDFFIRIKKTIRIKFLPDLKVGHSHSSSLKKTVKTCFERGFYSRKVCIKHKGDPSLNNMVVLKNISIKNFISFPIWMILIFFRKQFKDAGFIFLIEISWRLGVIWGSLKKWN